MSGIENEEEAGRAAVEYEHLLDRLASLAQMFATARELVSVFRALCDFARASIPCAGIFISLYDEESESRQGVYFWYNGEEIDVSGLDPVRIGDGPAGRAIKTGSVIISNDFQGDLKGKRVHVSFGFEEDPRVPRSALVAPMMAMGRTVGAIEVQSYEVGAYTQQHATAIRLAANLAAVAIENVRLFERERAHQEQLRQSQKMEAVGRLAGGIAHDFNNLLTAINGYSQIMLMRLSAGDPLRADLEEIRKAGERASTLTRQLLAFSRKQVLQPKVLDLNAIVSDLDKMLRRLIGEDVELVTLLRAEAGFFRADPGQIEQVIMNLAVNARDAMPGGGKLIIETASIPPGGEPPLDAAAGPYVKLMVSDNGYGMDAETLSHIYEPFFTTKDPGKGTGLGLSTVYGIVNQSGGHIAVRSDPGRGTSFMILFPQVEGTPEVLQRRGSQASLLRGSETILLVEDEDMVRKLALQVLEMNGYSVLDARHGGEALLICEQHKGPIHLMLTDVVMPHMSGPQLAERLAPLRPRMKVIYMSGYTSDAMMQSGTAFIQKPFMPESLALKVREVLDN